MRLNNSLFLRTLCIFIGNFLLALGIVAFVEATGVIMGGATGLGLIMQHFLGFDLAICVAILNVFFFILGYLFLGKKFALGTLISTIIYPLFLSFLSEIAYLQHLTEDMLLSTIYAGLLVGVGVGLVLRVGASTGGMDIPPVIINKKWGYPIPTMVWVFDIFILLFQLPFSNTEQILYGIILLLISTYAMDRVMILGESQSQVMIISPAYEEISQTIQKKLLRGVTLMKVKTGYHLHDQLAVLSVVSPRQVGALNDLVQAIDPTAFIIITPIHSVKGRGFTLPDIDL